MLVCYAIVFCFCIAELGWWFGNLSDSVIFFIMNTLQFVIFYTNFVSALYSGVSGEGSLVAAPPTADTKASIFPMIKCGWLISCFLFTLCALTHGWFIFVIYSLYCLWTLYCPSPDYTYHFVRALILCWFHSQQLESHLLCWMWNLGMMKLTWRSSRKQ